MFQQILVKVIQNRLILISKTQFTLQDRDLILKNFFTTQRLPIDKIEAVEIFRYQDKGFVIFVKTDKSKYNSDIIPISLVDQIKETLRLIVKTNNQVKLGEGVQEFINSENTGQLPVYEGNIFNTKFLLFVFIGVIFFIIYTAIQVFLSDNLPPPYNWPFVN